MALAPIVDDKEMRRPTAKASVFCRLGNNGGLENSVSGVAKRSGEASEAEKNFLPPPPV